VVVVDPITNYGSIGNDDEVKSMVTRLVDLFKSRQITAMFTSLTAPGRDLEDSVVGISSLIDTWLLFRNFEVGGERNRGLYVLKSRGMAHSNQVREFQLTDHGARLVEVYVGPEGILTGSARAMQQARDRAHAREQKEGVERKHVELENKRRQLESQISEMRAKFEAEERELTRSMAQLQARDEQLVTDRLHFAYLRQQGAAAARGNGRVLKEAV
jgi:circadian clock protein KaiC